MRLYKRLFIAGIVVYAVLCGLAILFYKERMALPDDANYVFELVTNGGHFAIFHHRFISVLTQWLPFAAIKLGYSLQSVTLLYSLNLTVFYALCYLVCGFVCRDYKAALAMLLSYLLFSSHTFYWAVPELGQGISLLFILFALLSRRESMGAAQIVLSGALIVFAVCAHALALFVLVFMLLYLWLHQRQNRRPLIIAAGWVVVALLFKSLFLRDEYDQHALGGLRNFIKLFPDYFSTESMRYFLSYCLGAYAWIPIILIINSIHYIRSRSWLKLGLMFCFCIGYLLLTTIAFPDVQGNGFYSENLFLPLASFLCIPLVYDVLPSLRAPLPTLAVFAVMLTGLLRIWIFHGFYSGRLAWQRGLIRQYDNRKVILDEGQFPKDTLLIGWSSPYELWLLSTIEQNRTASILITPEPDRYMQSVGDNRHVFMPAFNLYDYSSVSPRYFMFRDTVHSYEVVR